MATLSARCGGLPIKLDAVTIGGIGVSGAASDVDEAICASGFGCNSVEVTIEVRVPDHKVITNLAF